MTPPDNDLPVQGAFAGSAAGRLAIAVLNGLATAWDNSTFVSAVHSSAARFNRWPLEQRFRTSALTIMWAALWHLALRSILPVYATSAFPLWTNLLVAAIALLAALGSRAVVMAWPHSGAARGWRRSR